MSKHRAADRSAVRFAPLGAGMTVALLAAGTGSAFADGPVLETPTVKPTCEAATTALGDKQIAVEGAAKARDAAERELRQARADVRKAQASYRDALEDRDDAKERLESREDRQERKQAAFERARNRVAALEKSPGNERALRYAKRDLERAASELTDAKADTVKAGERLKKKEDALKLATGPTDGQRARVATATTALQNAETALDLAKQDRRDARAVRTDACTSGVSTLG